MTVEVVDNLVSDKPAAIVENAGGTSRILLVCEHAGCLLPSSIGSLGLDLADMASHIAWDPGAAELARELSKRLDACLILQRYSRLVFDCNRSLEAVDAIVEESDNIFIPGNSALSVDERLGRYELVYQPFYQVVSSTVTARINAGTPPVIVTIHSFTPVYKGQRRELELGILHDADSRLADSLLPLAETDGGYIVARNQPYSAEDGATHTLATHGVENGLLNVMFEVRNDLLSDKLSVERWAQRLEQLLSVALGNVHEQMRGN